MLASLASCEQKELEAPESDLVSTVEFSNDLNIPIVRGKLQFTDRVELDKVLDLGYEYVNETLTDHNFVSYHNVYENYNKELEQEELLPAEFDHDIVLELPEEAEGWFERIVPAIGVGMLVNAEREVLVGDTLFQVGYDDMDAIVVDADLNPISGTETNIVYPIMGEGESGLASRSQCGGWHTSPSILTNGCDDRRIRMKYLKKTVFRERLEVVSETRRERNRTFGRNCKWASTTEDQSQSGRMFGQYYINQLTFFFDGAVDKRRQRDDALYSSVEVPDDRVRPILGGFDFRCGPTEVTATMWWQGRSVSVTR